MCVSGHLSVLGHLITTILQYVMCVPEGGSEKEDPTILGIHYRGVQWEGGAVDWGSIM